jgi:D-alanyl-D-alanine carboxypeptidase
MTSMVSEKTGLPIRDVSAGDPSGFALNLGRKYAPEPAGPFWFYQGTTLGFRALFAYWPQHDLVITAITNSQPQAGEDQFATTIGDGARRMVQDAGWLRRD